MKNKPNILQINHADIRGGAGKISYDLFRMLNNLGYNTYFAVGIKESKNKKVIQISNCQNQDPFERFLSKLSTRFHKIPVLRMLSHKINQLRTLSTLPQKIRCYLNGIDDFEFPETSGLFRLIPHFTPHIIHCHSLCWGYFDLRMLPEINQKVPIVITHHDAWLIGGSCLHPVDCGRWRIGCGQCPLFSKKNLICRDGTADNWKQKAEIFKKCKLCVITPCQWLLDMVHQSMMKDGIIMSRVIPNGVDLNSFHPENKNGARIEMDLPINKKIILFVGGNLRKSKWKDYQTLKSTVKNISNYGIDVLCVVVGGESSSVIYGEAEIKFIPFVSDSSILTHYYNAADIYVHPARVDTFPTVILEALACGTPVVASAVGGIPEQIIEGKTGFLVPPGDSQTMAERIIFLLEHEEVRHQMGKQAAEDAKDRFGLERMVNEYVQVYEELVTGESVL